MDRRAFLAGLAALPAALVSGCGRAAGSRTLRFAYRTDWKSMDPAQCFDASTLQVMRLLYQGLYDCDDQLNFVPWLAEELPEVSADKRVYTIRLRPGIPFANGREVEAEDFVYSIRRIFDPATQSPGATFLRNVKGLHAPDRHTLRIELEKSDLAFLWLLTLPYTYPVPREEVKRHGETWYRNPCGTGPFVLTDWRRGLRLRFERNPLYVGPARPGLDAIEVLIGYDEMTQTMMFERGELDLLSIPQPDLVRLKNDPRWAPQVRSLRLQETEFLGMNCEMAPFTDRRVRQAVCHAVNRERLVQFLGGAGAVAHGLVPPGVFGHDPTRKGYDYDQERARRLLAEAGHPDGIDVDLWFPTDVPRWEHICQVVQQDLKRAGIRATLTKVAYAVFNLATARRNTVAFCMSGWTEDYPDARDFLGTMCDGTIITDDECTNSSFYNNDEVNRLLGDAAVATDEATRAGLFRRAEDLVMEDAPMCVLLHPIEYRMCQPRVRGCTLHPMWFIRYENLSLEAS
jgi:peptide/nickel transport system substrate-binding protein/oligopeptide transport system substrate-binding protein